MIRKVLSIVLVIFWMSFIFGFSNSNGDESGSFSRDVLVKVIEVFSDVQDGTEKMDELVEVLHFPFRKLAHFSIYFILGILVVNAFLAFGFPKLSILYAVIICIVYAITDEVHQSFVGGRVGSISDILLDSSGSCIAIYLISRFYILRGKHEKSVNK